MTSPTSSYSTDDLDNIDMIFIQNYPQDDLEELKEKAMRKAERSDHHNTLEDIVEAFDGVSAISLVYNYNEDRKIDTCDLEITCEKRVGDRFLWQFTISENQSLTACVSCAKDFVIRNSVEEITQEID